MLSVRVSHGLSQERLGHATTSAGTPPKRRFPQAAIVQGGLLVERGYITPDCMSHPWPFFAPAGIHNIADRKFRPARNRCRHRHRLRGTIMQLYHRRPQLPTEAAVDPDMLSGKSGPTRLRIHQPGWWGRALLQTTICLHSDDRYTLIIVPRLSSPSAIETTEPDLIRSALRTPRKEYRKAV